MASLLRKKSDHQAFRDLRGEDYNITSIKPYDHIYAKMDDQIFNSTPKLYKEYRNFGHAFGPVTRLRILDSLVKEALVDGLREEERQDNDEETTDSNIARSSMSSKYTYDELISPKIGAIKAWFPLHDEEDIFEIKTKKCFHFR